jgi:hypothetical protein
MHLIPNDKHDDIVHLQSQWKWGLYYEISEMELTKLIKWTLGTLNTNEKAVEDLLRQYFLWTASLILEITAAPYQQLD